MIILDTHTWIWWVDEDPRLSKSHLDRITRQEEGDIGISIISCWEVAKLVEYKRLKFSCSLKTWLKDATSYPKISLINLTPEIIIESVNLPDKFHKDPADQLITATARILDCPLITSDAKIKNYKHVKTI